MPDRKIIHVIGTGTIGEPLIGLLSDYKDKIGIDQVTFHKNSALKGDYTKVLDLQKRGAHLAVDSDKIEDFRAFGNPSGKIMCIIDDYPGLKPCIAFGNKIKSKIPQDEKINVYEFSLGNSMYQADFDKAGLGEDLVNLIPFPDKRYISQNWY